MFHGKIETVDETGKSLNVNDEKGAGWMDAMTMSCKVDDVPVLKRVKAADEIMATVYDGNIALHEVVVMPKPAGDAKSKKCAGESVG
jgi:hypothetical protein